MSTGSQSLPGKDGFLGPELVTAFAPALPDFDSGCRRVRLGDHQGLAETLWANQSFGRRGGVLIVDHSFVTFPVAPLAACAAIAASRSSFMRMIFRSGGLSPDAAPASNRMPWTLAATQLPTSVSR
jgi:hypothetical protein